MLAEFYRPNTPPIIHETIEGEIILVNLQNGSYYSTDWTGAFIWNHLEQGSSNAQLSDLAMQEYSGDPPAIRDGVINLLERLEQESLIVPEQAAPDAGPSAELTGSDGTKRPFDPPTLHKYTEMEDLLLLDPIHDVDDSGWPNRYPDNPAQ